MDPNVALSTIRARVADIRDISLAAENGGTIEEAAEEVADAFEALDEWLTKGGFLPAGWVTTPEPSFVDSVSVNVSVGVNNVDDHMLVALGDRSAKLDLWQAGWLHRQIGRRLNMQATGFIDVGNTV